MALSALKQAWSNVTNLLGNQMISPKPNARPINAATSNFAPIRAIQNKLQQAQLAKIAYQREQQSGEVGRRLMSNPVTYIGSALPQQLWTDTKKGARSAVNLIPGGTKARPEDVYNVVRTAAQPFTGIPQYLLGGSIGMGMEGLGNVLSGRPFLQNYGESFARGASKAPFYKALSGLTSQVPALKYTPTTASFMKQLLPAVTTGVIREGLVEGPIEGAIRPLEKGEARGQAIVNEIIYGSLFGAGMEIGGLSVNKLMKLPQIRSIAKTLNMDTKTVGKMVKEEPVVAEWDENVGRWRNPFTKQFYKNVERTADGFKVSDGTKTANFRADPTNPRRLIRDVKDLNQWLEKNVPIGMTIKDVGEQGGTKVWRATDSKTGKAVLGKGTYFAGSEEAASKWGSNVKEFTIKPEAKVLDLRATNDLDDFTQKAIKDNVKLYTDVSKAKGADVAVGEVIAAQAKKMGYDAINAEDPLGTVVFNNKMVSSDGPKIKAKPEPKLSAEEKLQKAILTDKPKPEIDTKLKIRTELVDKYAPVEEITKSMRADGKLKAENDPFKRIRLFSGVGNKIDKKLQGLSPILNPIKKNLDDFSKLLVADRIEELSGRGIEKFPGELTVDDAKAARESITARLNPEQLDALNTAKTEYRKYMRGLLDDLFNEGILNKESYEKITSGNEMYTPFQIVEYMNDNLERVGINKSGLSVASQDVIKTLEGSNKEILDPLQSTARYVAKATNLIERNQVAKSFLNLVGEVDGVHRRVPDEVIGKDSGVIAFFENGIKHEIVVPKMVEDSVKGMDKQSADILTGFARRWSGLLRAGATSYNVGFLVPNVIRDVSNAKVVAENGLTLGNWLNGFSSALKQDDMYDEWIKAGGGGGASTDIAATRPGIRKLAGAEGIVSKVINSPKQLLKEVGRISEESTRLGIYKGAKAAGESPMEAAFQSREGTVDFSKSGNTGKLVNQWVPFLNARFQGTLNLFKSLKNRPAQAGLNIAAVVGLPAVSTYLWNRRFKDFNDIREYEKENNFIIMARDRTPEEIANGDRLKAVKIPKGDVGKIFGNPIESLMAFTDGKDTKRIDKLALDILGEISPVGISPRDVLTSVLPTPLKAGVETLTNQNVFTGLPVEPEYQGGVQRENLPEELRAQKDTGPTAKLLGKLTGKIGLSPADLENITATLTGGLGRQVLTGTDIALGKKPGVEDIPAVRRFIAPRGGEAEAKLYEEANKFSKERGTQKYQARTKAEKIIADIRGMKPEQIKKYLIGIKGELTPEVISELKKAGERQAKLSGSAAKTGQISKRAKAVQSSGLSNADRAEFIFGVAKDMNKNEAYTFLVELKEAGILTKSLIKELSKQKALYAQQGNINLNNRTPVKNPDGSISTVRSISIEEDGKHILIPTVVNGRVVSDKEAINHYHKTGEYLGKFASEAAATAYAQRLHKQQEGLYVNK